MTNLLNLDNVVGVDQFGLNSTNLQNPTQSQITNNNFLPTYVQSPDATLSTSALGTTSSTAANTQNIDPILNRSNIALPIQTATNAGNVQGSNAIINSSPNAVQNSGSAQSQFLPNILDTFDNYTYNFTLSLNQNALTQAPTTTPTGPFYIVAQSGVSAQFIIKDVEIESIVGANPTTRNSQAQTISITIIEPQGLSLMDKLLDAIQMMGIQSAAFLPMTLELNFLGYNSSTGISQQIAGGKRVWRIRLQDISTKMNEGGSEYKLNFIAEQDLGFIKSSYAVVIPQTIVIENVFTVKQFFDKYGLQLSTISSQAALNNNLPKDTYLFNIDPSMQNWKISQNPKIANSPSMTVQADGSKTIIITPGLDIARLVDTIIANTSEAEQMVNPSSTPQKMGTDPTGQTVSKIAAVNCITKMIYNPILKDYDKLYTYYITKFDTPRTLIDLPTSTSNSGKVQYLQNQKLMVKNYQWIFTGENTDVLDVDIKLDGMWQQAITYYTSAIQRKQNVTESKFIQPTKLPSTPTQNDLRPQATTNNFTSSPSPISSSGFAASPGGLLQTQTPSALLSTNNQPSLISSVLSSVSKLATTSIPALNTLRTLVSNLTPSSPQAQSGASLSSGLTNLFSSNTSGVGNSLTTNQSGVITQSTVGLPNLASLVKMVPIQNASANLPSNLPVLSGLSTTRVNQNPNPAANPSVNPSSNSQINNTAAPTNTLIETLGTASQDTISKFYRKGIDPAKNTTRVNQNLEQSTNQDRTIYGDLTGQLYNEFNNDPYLLNIELEIRGDPYWLGETDTERSTRLVNNTANQTSKTNASGILYANYLQGEQNFVLSFKTPANYDENTGFVNIQQGSSLFAGVYAVQIVYSKFADGKFTQKFTAIRDQNISVKDVAQLISSSPNSVGVGNAGVNSGVQASSGIVTNAAARAGASF